MLEEASKNRNMKNLSKQLNRCKGNEQFKRKSKNSSVQKPARIDNISNKDDTRTETKWIETVTTKSVAQQQNKKLWKILALKKSITIQ